MAMKKVYSTKTGKVTWAQPNPARPGEYLMPADATEFPPPAFDDSSRKAKYVNNSWVTEDLTPEEIHEASGSTGSFINELNDIGDITLDSVTDGQALVWDADNNKWTNGNVAAGEGGVSGGGGVQQVKQVTKSDSWFTRENDFVDIPDLTITLTPNSENSKFLIIADLMTSTDHYCGEIQLTYNDTYIYQADTAGARPISSILVGREPSSHGESERSTLHYVHEPNTTEPVTYKLMGRGRKDDEQNGGLFINRTPQDRDTNTYDGRGISSLIVMEIDESSSGSVTNVSFDGSGVIYEKSSVGMVAPFAMSTKPNGWLICDGSTLDSVTNTEYAALYDAIGTTWGGSGPSDFKLPDLRGSFLRGIGTGSINGRDKFGPNSVGEFQEDEFQGHYHNIRYDTSGDWGHAINSVGGDNSGVQHLHEVTPAGDDGYGEHDSNGKPRHGSETRPYNAGILYCIKYSENEIQTIVDSQTNVDGPSFHVVLGGASNDTRNQTPLLFTSVKTNHTNSYDPATGLFTAPEDGYYQFGAGAHCHAQGGWTTIRLHAGGDVISNAWENDAGGNSGQLFCAGVQYLYTGDTAYVSMDTGKPSNYMAETYWYFYGYKIANGNSTVNITSSSGSSIESLNDVTDVTVDTPTDGQVLSWDETNSAWKNSDIENIESLNDINDVTVDTPTDGQVLTWDDTSSAWKNNDVQNIESISDINDVTVDTPTDKQVLAWDESAGKWINENVVNMGGIIRQVKNYKQLGTVTTEYPSTGWADVQTINFTPKSATSKILVSIVYGMAGKGALCLVRDGVAVSAKTTDTGKTFMNWQTTEQVNSDYNSERFTMSMTVEDTPNTTDTVTYKTQIHAYDSYGNQGGICVNPIPYNQGNGVYSSVTIWEIDESNDLQNIVDSQTGPPEVYFVASIHRPEAIYYNQQFLEKWTLREEQSNSFDTNTGTFTAPKQGLYRFDFFDNFRTGSGGHLYWDWYKNSSSVGYGRVYGNHAGGWEGMSGHLIVSLEEGDTMRIRIFGNDGVDPDGGIYSLFTGYIMNQGANVTISNGTNYAQLDTNASQGPTSLANNSELPSYACRAFCTFDGTDVTTVNGESHCRILSSGNISKVVRHSAGWYRVYFKTPMPDNNYSPTVTGTGSGTSGGYAVLDSQDFGGVGSNNLPQSWFNIRAVAGGSSNIYTDHPCISIQVFR